MAYCHPAFWQCMETLRETKTLNALREAGEAPWKVWE
jgi:glucose-1-phosphate cytidylyltransferase